MSDIPKFQSFKDFYPFYLSQHSKTGTQITHFIGTFLLFVVVFSAFRLHKPALLWYLPIVGYGFAWFGHFFVEKNKPATFKYPFYSLMGDFLMFWHILTFQIKAKMDEAMRLYA